MNIIINTDASFNNTTKTGAYAFSIVHEDFRITYSAKFSSSPTSSTEAEGWCVINAMVYFFKNVYAYHYVDSVTVFNDNIHVIDGMNCPLGKVKKPPKLVKERIRWMMEDLLRKRAVVLRINWQWVKGHQAFPLDATAKENKWCDKAAERASRGIYEHQIEFFKDTLYMRDMKFGAKIKKSYV